MAAGAGGGPGRGGRHAEHHRVLRDQRGAAGAAGRVLHRHPDAGQGEPLHGVLDHHTDGAQRGYHGAPSAMPYLPLPSSGAPACIRTSLLAPQSWPDTPARGRVWLRAAQCTPTPLLQSGTAPQCCIDACNAATCAQCMSCRFCTRCHWWRCLQYISMKILMGSTLTSLLPSDLGTKKYLNICPGCFSANSANDATWTWRPVHHLRVAIRMY